MNRESREDKVMKREFDTETQSLMEHLLKGRNTAYSRARSEEEILERCLCTEKSHASCFLNNGRKERLVAYVRANTQAALDAKIEHIKTYCLNHGYQILEIFADVSDHPSFGFKAALDALESVDGLISIDLNQFVSNHGDRLRELRPLIHHFFCYGGKHLITIDDGIDTGTQVGQQNAIELISQTSAGFET